MFSCREYKDEPSADPHFHFYPCDDDDTSTEAVYIIATMTAQARSYFGKMKFAHLAMLRLLKSRSFETVLDVGSGVGNETAIFRFFGKKVTALSDGLEPNTHTPPDVLKDYLDFCAPAPYDCIWCSHALEHVRNPGAFLSAMFYDLKPGGTLALTVPYNEFNGGPGTFTLGHCNRFNMRSLLYHLILAGFDCRSAAAKVYNRQLSIIVERQKSGKPCIPPRTQADVKDAAQFFPLPTNVKGPDNEEPDNVNWEGLFT